MQYPQFSAPERSSHFASAISMIVSKCVLAATVSDTFTLAATQFSTATRITLIESCIFMKVIVTTIATAKTG